MFLTKLEEAQLSGELPSAPLPEAYLSKPADRSWLNISQAEGNEIVAAKLAHILFVEVNGLVPWLLADYDEAALDSLFDICKQLGCSFGRNNKTTYFRFDNLVDHSPREVWGLLEGSIEMEALTDPSSGVVAILEHVQGFRHGSRDLDPDLGILTVTEMAEEKVARRGCWSMSPYVAAVAASLNIPTDLTYGYYAGQAHRSVLIEAIDGVLAHGDDVYNASLRNTPARQRLDSYQRWQAEVLKYDPLEGPSSPAGYNSRIHNYEMARLYPSRWMLSGYCSAANDREFLENFFGNFATGAELDDLELRITDRTADCSTLPADDPQ